METLVSTALYFGATLLVLNGLRPWLFVANIEEQPVSVVLKIIAAWTVTPLAAMGVAKGIQEALVLILSWPELGTSAGTWGVLIAMLWDSRRPASSK